MPLLALVSLLLLALPLVEIGVFILVGAEIGVGWTLALVTLSAVLGAVLLRRQGFATFARAKAEAARGRLPERELAHGAMIVLAAILLLVPGFVTDVLGLALFVPAIREAVWRRLRSGAARAAASQPTVRRPPARPANDVVDLSGDEFSRRERVPRSPWRLSGEDEDDFGAGRGPDAIPPNRTLH